VIIADFLTDDLAPERALLGEWADVHALNAFAESELVGRIESADAILLYHNTMLTRPTLERLERCRLIVRCGVGVDNVDHAFARTRGIAVANVPDYGTEEVADSALGLVLALTRGLCAANGRLQAHGEPWSYVPEAPLFRLRGRTCGLIGVGCIGTAMALRAKAFGLRVAFYDPYVTSGLDKALGIRRCDTLAELLAHSHIISVHCPLTAETRHLLDAAAFARLPHGAYLVNTARGAIVDTQALLAALASGQVAGAALDVLPHEPPLTDDPLLRAWRDPTHPAHRRLILNPHAAFYSVEGLLDMRTKGAENVRRLLRGEPVRNVVN
jgi:D-3-phosphoglycerate dehydrogenase/C-terminal binding protein